MNKKSRFVKHCVLALGLLFLVCTLFLIVQLGNQLYWQHLGRNLAITEGFIEQVNLVKAHRTGKDRSDRWWLEVKYSYIVDGEHYSSDRLNSSNSAGGQEFLSLAKEYEKALRDKTEVAVYYYKFDPSKSVLMPDSGSRILIGHFIIVLVFGLMTIGTLFLFRFCK